MKVGTTGSKYIALNDLKTTYVTSIIFTFKSLYGIVQKTYPTDVVLENGEFRIDFAQEDTLELSPMGTAVKIKCEAQINYINGTVQKTDCAEWNMDSTIATKLIDGNKSDGSEDSSIELNLKGEVLIVSTGGSDGTSDYNDLINKPSINGVFLSGNKSLEELGVNTEITNYVESHKDELKGDKGDTGANGADGQDGADGYTPVRGTDYWTAADIAEIQSYIDSQIGGALNGSY